MGGDGYALALAAGADLVDMEFVQFFPIGHLAPRLVGMDPIMWDPFRYKLGGRLLDGQGREFLADYGSDETAATRRRATSPPTRSRRRWRQAAARRMAACTCRSRTCRGKRWKRPSGRSSNGWRENGIDLGRMPVEVAPIAHYHMGGIAVDERMASRVPGLYAAGEAAGGANGANRLSGNAIPEALVFGERAGRFAAAYAASRSAALGPASRGAGGRTHPRTRPRPARRCRRRDAA